MRSLPSDSVSRALASHPAPIADAVFALKAAENLHERRDRVVEVFRTILRLLSTIALAARLQRGTGGGDDTPHIRELLRTLRQRGLTDGQWLDLTRELLRPWAQASAGHPLPALVELVHGKERKRFAANTAGLLEMRKSETIAHGKTGDSSMVFAFLEERLPQVDWLLRALDPIWAGARLVVPRARPDAAEEQQQAFDMNGLRSGTKWLPYDLAPGVRIPPGEPVLVDPEGKPLVALHPVALCRKPTPEAPEELFVLEGGDRKGAVFRSYPAFSEHAVPEVWPMLENALGAGEEAVSSAVAGEQRPFRGLEAFARRHAALFFGREQEAEALANRIRKHAVVTVTGPSGAGKTSLLQAGVLLHLETFETVTLRPGADPLGALTQQLRQSLASWPDLEQALAKLQAHPESLGDALLHWVTWKRRELQSDAPAFLLIVDQSEELFTLCRNDEARRDFARALASLAPNDNWPTRLVLSIRGDFLTYLSEVAPLQGTYNREIELISRPGPEALARTLTEPARLFGFRFEDRKLVETMVQAVAHVPSALALLQFCADRMWDQRDRAFSQLTWSAYRSMNGVEGAIAEHAERVFSELSESQQLTARHLFLRLVTEDRTRQVIARSELLGGLAQPADADVVLDKLVRARLVAAREDADNETRVELVHEALITHWPRFKKWLEEDLEWVLVHARLSAAARRWQGEGRAGGFLLREGKELGEAEELARSNAAMLSDTERALVVASRVAIVRGRRLRGLVMAGMTLLAVLATGAAIFAWKQQRAASHNLAVMFDEKAASAERLLKMSEAEVFRAAGLNEEDTPGRRQAYVRARLSNPAEAPPVTDGHHTTARPIVEEAGDTLRVVDSSDHHAITTVSAPPQGSGEPLLARRAARDGKAIVIVRNQKNAEVWSSQRMQSGWTNVEVPCDATTADFSPNDDLLIVGCTCFGSEFLAVWRIADGRWLARPPQVCSEHLEAPRVACAEDGAIDSPGCDSYRAADLGVVERLFSGKSASLLAESQVRTGLRLDGAHIEEVLAPPPNGLMQERSEPRSELTFVHIPGGRFHLGCELQDSDCEKDEGPTRYATVTPFWLGKTEVTVAAYTKCVTAGACTPPRDPGSGCTWNVPGKENHPINCIDWNQATRFCEWIGGRLPTAKEWEYAAKGGRSRIYPWGDELPDRNRANFDSQGTDPVGMHPEGATPQGVLDMAGNLCEWTSSSYSATSKEVRGGSWNVDGRWLRVSYRNGTGASVGGDGTGVRCALSQ